MKHKNIIQTGGLFLVTGFILITLSWYYTYPIYISSIDEVTFSQFFALLWPGLLFSLIGIFLIGYYSSRKIIQATCCCLCPILLYITTFFFSYISSSDCGNARSIFLVFQKVGINSHIISYFEFPHYFVLNEILHQTCGVNEKGVALISFILYGILLALFLYLIFSKLMGQKYNQLSFLLVIIYFIGMFSFLNYQWAPQTLALVYFFLLIFVSIYLLSEPLTIVWKCLTILIFLSLTLTHSFIPLVFLLFFGILTIKKRYLLQLLLFMISIYLFITIYFTMIHLEMYIETFRQSIQGFGGDYTAFVSKSFREPEDAMSQIISNINRIRIPLVWIIALCGTVLLFLKRKIEFFLIALSIAGGAYLTVGIFYSILGLRTFQILFIPMTIGFTFFIFKWKKLTLFVILVILILAVFGPMRMAYNETQFQTDEEANACNFLANNITVAGVPRIAVNQVDYGYFKNVYIFLRNNTSPIIIRPGEKGFFNIFNRSMNYREYVIYNPNLGKEILNIGMTKGQLFILLRDLMFNNKIYDCGKTYIVNGILPKTKH